ncbi:DUF2905 domain-containing protein [Nitratifractor salsuginis]|uniref:DUF2905 domain-containing protein n=1 Tax=Nitratifractor salsuginis (strain DSM 16511 / JCM 12458 / E9I37-1) TaxID=749222 RepID=E6X2B7_NITSE|nr:DUF2905 domain-containing protein [Nitratifractor salsuginis]ADV46052.1 hypothetical protein Nitsa_0787 [Nitratifractor salsuginis DSM 16511]
MGKVLMVLGLFLILLGAALQYGLLGWFGKLPGDIRYQGENFVFYAPITSMLLLSILFSLILWLFNR